MLENLETIKLNDILYVKYEDLENRMADKYDGMEYVICRTYSAGVFAGYLEKRDSKEAVLRKARRIWHWEGAATLSQLATDGTANPAGCNFPCEVDSVVLTECIEIISVTKKAQKSISEVPIWEM